MAKINKNVIMVLLLALLALTPALATASQEDTGADGATVIKSDGVNATVVVGDTYIANLTYSQSVGQTWTVVSLPSWITFDQWGPLINGTANAVGTYNIVMHASSASQNEDVSWTVTVVSEQPTQYTVTYNNPHGTMMGGIDTQYSGAVIQLKTPGTYDGCPFLGWYTAPTGGTRVGGTGDDYTVASDITLYALWDIEYTFTLSYNPNGGSGSSTSTYASNQNSHTFTVKSTTPVRSGYTFLGWSLNSNATEAQYHGGDSISVTSSSTTKTLYAVWTEVNPTYTVTFDANGGAGTVPNQMVVSGNEITLPSTGFTLTGYYQAAWAVGSPSGTQVSIGGSYAPSASATLYAVWVEIPDNIDTIAPATGQVGVLYTYSPNWEDASWQIVCDEKPNWLSFNEAYPPIFSGTPTGVGVYDVHVHLTSTVLFSPGEVSISWIITVAEHKETYTVTFNANGGSGSVASMQEIQEGNAILLPPEGFTRSGYDLAGWQISVNGSPAVFPRGSLYTVVGDTNVKAYWTSIPNIVIIDADGGTGTTAYIAEANGVATLPVDGLSKSGYALRGFYSLGSPTEIYALGYIYPVQGSVHMVAYWVADGTTTYKATFNNNGGTGTLNQNVQSGKYVVLPYYGFTLSGSSLVGWSNSSGSSTADYDLGDAVRITSAKTFYAVWEESTSSTVMVTFSLNGGTGSAPSLSVSSGSTVSAPVPPVRQAHIFTGWKLVGGSTWTPSTPITDDVTIQAQWAPHYTISIGGTVMTVTLASPYSAGSSTIVWGDGSDDFTGYGGVFAHDYEGAASGTITVSTVLTGSTYASSYTYSISAPADPGGPADPGDEDDSESSIDWMLIIGVIISLLAAIIVVRFLI
ncbi:MAG: InlB B-repeat-containing protein [Gudongella sp.]|nr:InlB B-repeat-containing protein [Gudongella sp.]